MGTYVNPDNSSMKGAVIDAYYSKGCDSEELFSPYEIAGDPDFTRNLNKYNVLHFDVATYFNSVKNPEDIIPSMDKALLLDMTEEFPFLAGLNPGTTAILCTSRQKRRKRQVERIMKTGL